MRSKDFNPFLGTPFFKQYSKGKATVQFTDVYNYPVQNGSLSKDDWSTVNWLPFYIGLIRDL